MDQNLVSEYHLPALYMLWSSSLPTIAPFVQLPTRYAVQPYQQDDQHALYPLFANEGWSIAEHHWQDYIDHIIPNGLFMLWHLPGHQLIGTAGAIHNPRGGRYYFPFGGELAYLVIDPQHRGHGLGAVLTAYVVQRLQAAGYEHIWLGVQGFRLPAIKTYLKLGFVPFLHLDGLAERWQRICDQIPWRYTPDEWPSRL